MEFKSANELKMNEQLTPFFWTEHESSTSLCHYVGGFKDEVFALRADEGFEGGGYDWEQLAIVFLNEKMPELKNEINFDSEASMFCAYIENSEDINNFKKFALGFRNMCDNEEMMKDLFSRAELD